MASLINEAMAVFYITFWRGAANPQSGEINDCSDEIYDLTPDLHYKYIYKISFYIFEIMES